MHQMLVLAGGGESCADIEYLRVEDDLFADVCSDSTLYRTFTENLDEVVVSDLKTGFAEVRKTVWRRAGLIKGKDAVVLDIDASLIDVHSEHKEGTAPNYKFGFGFHPMFCIADVTGEALSALLASGQRDGQLRRGPSGGSRRGDRASCPKRWQPATVVGDDPDAVRRDVVVRTDSAGASQGFVWGCRERNVGFAVAARSNAQIKAAISKIADDERRWKPALRQDGRHRKGAAVTEVTHLVDLSHWPPGTRLLIRREPLHPGAQASLFPSLEYRYWGHYTDQVGAPSGRDLFMRGHANVEDALGRLKDAGFCASPSSICRPTGPGWPRCASLTTWCAGSSGCASHGDLASAEPKSLRWRLWHAPARKVRSGRQVIVRILDTWPDARPSCALTGASPCLPDPIDNLGFTVKTSTARVFTPS